MKITLDELTIDQVVGLNAAAVADAHRKNPGCQEKHFLRDRGGLAGCIDGIFTQVSGIKGYENGPLEKMAGLLLYRIAEKQFFENGNKRTALLSCRVFLGNNGHKIRVDANTTSDLLWGFAKDQTTGKAKYFETDAIQFVYDNIFPVF